MEFLDFLIKNWLLVTIFIVSGALLFLWPQLQNRFSSARGVNSLEATRLINAGSIVIIDVRDAQAYAEGHLGKAINIPLADIKNRLPELRKKSAKNILVYCERGQRSLTAAKSLAELGKDVHSLQGGIVAWKEAGLPVEKAPEKPTPKGAAKAANRPAADPSSEKATQSPEPSKEAANEQ